MKKTAFIFALMFLVFSTPAHAINVEEVTSPGGITAWLVEDHQLPLISMQFAFKGGVEQDPVDKQGLATLTMNLLAEGAGPYDAAQFQQQLADNGIQMSFGAGRDALTGGIKMLSADRVTAFKLLHLALSEPRFDPAAVDRLRAQQITSLRFELGDPGWQARYALLSYIFAGHPYSERSLGTAKSLAGLSQNDIEAFTARHLARDNLLVAVAGDITPAELAPALDRIFGNLPATARLETVPEAAWPPKPAIILVPRKGTQTDLLFAEPGPKRAARDWFAADIANYILGGGGFSARLMRAVRDKRGLTYGIGTQLAPMKHAAIIVGSAATDNAKTGKAWGVTLGVMRGFYKSGVTAGEIKGAKDYLTGSLPLDLTSTDAIASALIEMQLDHLGPDYLDKRNGMIRAVTKAQVAAAIARWFDPARVTLAMVGAPEGVTPSVTELQVRK
ncbi:MAG TPA: pitrilysin family protein [Alphaproteobacteria bacterium]|nr:pitrilysin family protein [Alphaproteobacteria bacterium]